MIFDVIFQDFTHLELTMYMKVNGFGLPMASMCYVFTDNNKYTLYIIFILPKKNLKMLFKFKNGRPDVNFWPACLLLPYLLLFLLKFVLAHK